MPEEAGKINFWHTFESPICIVSQEARRLASGSI